MPGKRLLYILLGCGLLAGCVEKDLDFNKPFDKNIVYDGEISVPFFTTDFKIVTLFDKFQQDSNIKYLVVNGDDISLCYQDTWHFSLDDLMNVDLTLPSERTDVAIPGISGTFPAGQYDIASGGVLYSGAEIANIVRLDQVVITSGTMRIEVEQSGFQGLNRNNYLEMTVSPSGNIVFPDGREGFVLNTYDKTYIDVDLAGAMLKSAMPLQGMSIYFGYGIKMRNATPVFVFNPEASLKFSFSGLSFSEIRGRFTFDYPGTETIDISGLSDIFGDLTGSQIEFSDPSVNLSVRTNLGIPVQLEIGKISGYKSTDPSHDYSLSGFPRVYSPLVVPTRPDELLNVISVNLGKKDGVNDLLSAIPDRIRLDYRIRQDDDAFADGAVFFITPDSELSVNADISLPLSFDNLDIGYTQLMENVFTDDLRKLFGNNTRAQILINIYAQNSLPLDMSIGLVIKDEDGQSLITLNRQTAVAGQVDAATKRVTAPRTSLLRFEVPAQESNKLQRARNIEMTYRVESNGAGDSSEVIVSTGDGLKLSSKVLLKGNVSVEI